MGVGHQRLPERNAAVARRHSAMRSTVNARTAPAAPLGEPRVLKQPPVRTTGHLPWTFAAAITSATVAAASVL